jgi:hypothetical protein
MSTNTFVADLDKVVSVLLAAARAKGAGVSAEESVSILAKHGIEVPGENATAQAINMRALFSFVSPEVGGTKRGPTGGFCPVELLPTKEKSTPKSTVLANSLRKQGLSEEAIREVLQDVSTKKPATVAA